MAPRRPPRVPQPDEIEAEKNPPPTESENDRFYLRFIIPFLQYFLLCIGLVLVATEINIRIYQPFLQSEICTNETIPAVIDGRIEGGVKPGMMIMPCRAAAAYNEALISSFLGRLRIGLAKRVLMNDVNEFFYASAEYKMALTRNSDNNHRHFMMSYSLWTDGGARCTKVGRRRDGDQAIFPYSFCIDGTFRKGFSNEDSMPVETNEVVEKSIFRTAFLKGEYADAAQLFYELRVARNEWKEYQEIVGSGNSTDIMSFLESPSEYLYEETDENEHQENFEKDQDRLKVVDADFLRALTAMAKCDPLRGDTWSDYLYRALFSLKSLDDCQFNNYLPVIRRFRLWMHDWIKKRSVNIGDQSAAAFLYLLIIFFSILYRFKDDQETIVEKLYAYLDAVVSVFTIICVYYVYYKYS